MGNDDGFFESMNAFGKNEVLDFNGGYFSFAHGDEIALVPSTLSTQNPFWILNCDRNLWDEVLAKFTQASTWKEAVSFWQEKSKTHEISDWSHDFSELE